MFMYAVIAQSDAAATKWVATAFQCGYARQGSCLIEEIQCVY